MMFYFLFSDLSNKDGTMFLEKSKNAMRMLRNGWLMVNEAEAFCFVCVYRAVRITANCITLSHTHIPHTHTPCTQQCTAHTRCKSAHPPIFEWSPGHRPERHRHSSVRLSSSHTKSSPVLIKKANSCSTIYTDDSTVSVPNLKFTIKW